MKKALIVIFALIQVTAFASATEPTRPDAKSVFTLFRNSVLSESLRIHVATFDSKDGFGYNKENCEVAKKLFQKQQGVRVKYWCENGYFGAAPREDEATSESVPSSLYRYGRADHVTGTELLERCQSKGTVESSFCMGYAAGVADTVGRTFRFRVADRTDIPCMPAGLTLRQLSDMALYDLRGMRSNGFLTASSILHLGLIRRFRCER